MSMRMRPLAALMLLCVSGLQGCASSNLSHSVNDQMQAAYSSGDSAVGSVSQMSPSRAWQGSSQTAKGILLGSLAGGAAGWMTPGIGLGAGAIGGAIFGGALGAWVDDNTTAADRLKNRGVQVMKLGDQVRVVLLSDDLFEMDSTQLSLHAYPTLDGVVQLVNHYPNRSVSVTAYTIPGDRGCASEAFTKAQAESVMRYLWQQGINTRLLTARGAGSTHPVARPGGSHPGDNNRVEITLEKLPV